MALKRGLIRTKCGKHANYNSKMIIIIKHLVYKAIGIIN